MEITQALLRFLAFLVIEVELVVVAQEVLVAH